MVIDDKHIGCFYCYCTLQLSPVSTAYFHPIHATQITTRPSTPLAVATSAHIMSCTYQPLQLNFFTPPPEFSKTLIVETVFWWTVFNWVSFCALPLKSICLNIFRADSSRSSPRPGLLFISRDPAISQLCSLPRSLYISQSWTVSGRVLSRSYYTHIACSDDFALSIPNQAEERK